MTPSIELSWLYARSSGDLAPVGEDHDEEAARKDKTCLEAPEFHGNVLPNPTIGLRHSQIA